MAWQVRGENCEKKIGRTVRCDRSLHQPFAASLVLILSRIARRSSSVRTCLPSEVSRGASAGISMTPGIVPCGLSASVVDSAAVEEAAVPASVEAALSRVFPSPVWVEDFEVPSCAPVVSVPVEAALRFLSAVCSDFGLSVPSEGLLPFVLSVPELCVDCAAPPATARFPSPACTLASGFRVMPAGVGFCAAFVVSGAVSAVVSAILPSSSSGRRLPFSSVGPT